MEEVAEKLNCKFQRFVSAVFIVGFTLGPVLPMLEIFDVSVAGNLFLIIGLCLGVFGSRVIVEFRWRYPVLATAFFLFAVIMSVMVWFGIHYIRGISVSLGLFDFIAWFDLIALFVFPACLAWFGACVAPMSVRKKLIDIVRG